MKCCFAVVAVFIHFMAYCQDDNTNSSPKGGVDFVSVVSTNTYAYIHNTRLDSLDAFYASFSTKFSNNVVFDYGQNYSKAKEIILTNEKDIPLVFSNTSMMFLLNFFHYNHWNLAVAPAYLQPVGWILKKEDAR